MTQKNFPQWREGAKEEAKKRVVFLALFLGAFAPLREILLPSFRRALALAILLLAGIAAAAEPDEVPVIGRPADLPFSEASAGFVRQGDEYLCPFRLEVAATPRRVEAEQPLLFSVTIHALGEVRRPPVRLKLAELPAFERSFHVEDVTEGEKEQIGPRSWRWVYRLKPQRVGIDEVPRLPFVFYNPDLKPSEKAFQVIWTDAVPLEVSPPEEMERFVNASGPMLWRAKSPGVLADESPWSGPGRVVLASVVAGPPLLSVAWYLAWRRANPDAARRAAQRRSRAAQRAASALKAAERLKGKPRAEATARAVIVYLRERFDLPIAEPTPDEAAAWLERSGFAGDDLNRLLRECASERFGLDAGPADVVAAARAFLTTIEEPPRT